MHKILFVIIAPLSLPASEPPGSRITAGERSSIERFISTHDISELTAKIYPEGQLPFPVDKDLVEFANKHLEAEKKKYQQRKKQSLSLIVPHIKAYAILNLLTLEHLSQLAVNNNRIICMPQENSY